MKRYVKFDIITSDFIKEEIEDKYVFKNDFEHRVMLENLKHNIMRNYLLNDIRRSIKNLYEIIIVFIIAYFLFR